MKRVILCVSLVLTMVNICFATTYIVANNGTGDFLNIASAVAAASDGDQIVIYGTGQDYTGTQNRNIVLDGSQKHLRIIGMNNPVIDLENTSRAFIAQNTNASDCITDIRFENGLVTSNYVQGGAIMLSSGELYVEDCEFWYMMIAGEYFKGGSISVGEDASATIVNCNFYSGGYTGTLTLPGNRTIAGGVIYSQDAEEIIISNCQFIGNSAKFASCIGVSGDTDIEITNCRFSSNMCFMSGTICVWGTSQISDALIQDCEFSNNIAQSGDPGIYAQQTCVSISGMNSCLIQNNEFDGNRAEDGSACIYFFHITDMVIDNNEFTDNRIIEGGGATAANSISASSCSAHILNNKFIENYGMSPCISLANVTYNDPAYVELNIWNNTFDNTVSIGSYYHPLIFNHILDSSGINVDIDVRNCIMINNDALVLFYSPDFDYGDIYCDYAWMNNNTCHPIPPLFDEFVTYGQNMFSGNPYLDTSHTPMWNSSVRSPVIDAGYPSIADDDGTPSDIGAVRAQDHDFERYSYRAPGFGSASDYEWVCYPVVDNVYTAENNASDFFEDIDEDLTALGHNNVWGTDYGTYWEYPWEDDPDDTDPTDGFKLQVSSGTVMNKVGFLADPDTEITLTASSYSYWIGYFIEESQYPLDALADVLDDLTEIKHHDWTLVKTGLGWLGGSSYTINYGDMVELTCESNCSFAWNDNLSRTAPAYKEQTSHYSVEEDAGYTPVYLDVSGYSDNMPEEIGMYADGELIGATVVDGEITQINAYVEDIENLEEAEVSFELFYGDRAPLVGCDMYKVNSDITEDYIKTTHMFETQSRYYQVTLGKGGVETLVPDLPETVSINNYPNPFNPETTVSFTLPQDGKVSIKVFNVRGQLVKTLVDNNLNAGKHEIVWNGRDEENRQVGSGIYFCRLQTAGKILNRKLLMMK